MTRIDFQPPITLQVAVAFLAAIFAAWLLLRLLGGPRSNLARRAGLVIVRAAVVVVLLALFTGPVRVDETPGPVRRPEVFFLLDGSQSMGIGNSATRWDQAVDAVSTARAGLPNEAALETVQLFRFGHRLSAVEKTAGSTDGPPLPPSVARHSVAAVPPRSGGLQKGGSNRPLGGPTDSDTRMAEGLRQLSGRFGQRPPGAVVLFSDGRARDAEAVAVVARHFGERRIPVHVYPVGDTARGGDVAIVSVVAPQRVRKYSDVEVQVFLRSFGYSGRRTEIQLVAVDGDGSPDEPLAALPVTLRGGAQSVTLTFRSDTRGRALEVRIPEQPDELSTRNNRMAAGFEIDRTKIRVLYIEGSGQGLRVVSRGGRNELAGAFSPLQESLMEDEEIECVTLVRLPGDDRLYRVQSYLQQGRQGFPETLAELSAFDCVILSDVPARCFTEEELAWLEQWVENRGGGLCMAGGERSFAAGGWSGTPIAGLLPVALEKAAWTPGAEAQLEPVTGSALHSVWQILADRQQNRKIIESIPAIAGMTRGLEPKPLADVLAVTRSAAAGNVEDSLRESGNVADSLRESRRGSRSESPTLQPLIVAGRYGRGRTLAIAVPITPPAAEKFLNEWGSAGNRYSGKFWRNVVYWLTEGSFVGRRRLIASVDKRFYRPGEAISLTATAYDEAARPTGHYSIWAMIEPQNLELDDESLVAPVRWPNGVPRDSGEEDPHIAWGEEIELPRDAETGQYRLPLELADRLRGGASDQGLRVELTAYESAGSQSGFPRGTQVDSTSLEVQILDDPFEQQNPFPNHDLLRRVANVSGGRVLSNPQEVADVVTELPIDSGPPVVSTVPLWNRWWLLAGLVGLLTVEWVWRRAVGLA